MQKKLKLIFLGIIILITFLIVVILLLNRALNTEETKNVAEVIYEISYTDLTLGNSVSYRFEVDSNYQIQANKTSVGSFVGATEINEENVIKLSENNKKYLKNVLKNLDENIKEKMPRQFSIIDKKSNKAYLIDLGSKEHTILSYILIYEREITQDIMIEYIQ